jgi:hypothetical protein
VLVGDPPDLANHLGVVQAEMAGHDHLLGRGPLDVGAGGVACSSGMVGTKISQATKRVSVLKRPRRGKVAGWDGISRIFGRNRRIAPKESPQRPTVRGAGIRTHDREVPRVLDALDSILVRAIKGVFWLPFVFLPSLIMKSFASVLKLLRLGILFVLWDLVVFGPLVLLAEVHDPVPVMAIVCWSLFALVGSAVGVMKLKTSTGASANAAKNVDFAEAFV